MQRVGGFALAVSRQRAGQKRKKGPARLWGTGRRQIAETHDDANSLTSLPIVSNLTAQDSREEETSDGIERALDEARAGSIENARSEGYS